jgi:hypothetical protein
MVDWGTVGFVLGIALGADLLFAAGMLFGIWLVIRGNP